MKIHLLSFVAVLLAAGCTPPPKVAAEPLATSTEPSLDTEIGVHKVTVGKQERVYYMVEPAQCKGHLNPGLIVLHGRGGMGNGAIRGLHLIPLAEKHGIVLFAPDASEAEHHIWQDGASTVSTKEDIEYFKYIFDHLKDWDIDPKKVWILGGSNGGAMASWIGAKFADRVGAICSEGASIGAMDTELNYHEMATPIKPISNLMLHGMKDMISGYGMESYTVGQQDALRWWAKRIGATKGPEHMEMGNGKVLFDRFSASDGREVILLSYKEAGHEWPSEHDKETGMDANEYVWQFFLRHPPK